MGKDAPKTEQPKSGDGGGWMAGPQDVPGCPKGLEYLAMVDQLIVMQQIEMLEAFTSWETNNRYEIKNVMGQKIGIAVEETNCCTRNCCGAKRNFHMKLMDNYAKPIMTIDRPLRCDTCWCPCFLQEAEVKDGDGNLMGKVEQTWSIMRPSWKITNAQGETVLNITGPCFTCNMCGDVKFEVFTADSETQVGEIRKQWSGLVKEAFTDADNFGLTFPTDMEVNAKGCLLAAVFLIDFMFFERSGNKPQDPKVGMTGVI